jgi:hypothetical protein
LQTTELPTHTTIGVPKRQICAQFKSAPEQLFFEVEISLYSLEVGTAATKQQTYPDKLIENFNLQKEF